jgi:hypothetical protein
MLFRTTIASKYEMASNIGMIKKYHAPGMVGNFLFKKNLVNKINPTKINTMITNAIIVTLNANDSIIDHLCYKYKQNKTY